MLPCTVSVAPLLFLELVMGHKIKHMVKYFQDWRLKFLLTLSLVILLTLSLSDVYSDLSLAVLLLLC